MGPDETMEYDQAGPAPANQSMDLMAHGDSTRIRRFFVTWSTMGMLGVLPAGFASLIVWLALDEPTHCGFETSCSTDGILSNGLVPLCCVWGFWFIAGVIAWVIGLPAAVKNRRFGSAPALVSGAIVFGVGLLLAGWTLQHGIDASHGP
ncbi:hypothetical protein [Nocardia niigatensis]|uniref:hypothetical protein n=1 Tax=Nocardia niigatensis TaxID=209249 RepID=UPI0012F6E5F2|nr:hypothetical protein [Nocardia niigatensis]